MSGKAPSAGHSTLEVCVASALLALSTSAALGGATMAQRDATLASMRQTAIALAGEGLERLATGAGPDEGAWRMRVSTALPAGAGIVRAEGGGQVVEVRWRAPGITDTRCPGLVCVVLAGGA